MIAPVNHIALKIFGEWKFIMRLSSKIVKYEPLNVSCYKISMANTVEQI